ncbi:hypothetical protein TraAM80_07236 [Trypanosoma rangeli]|uniref:Uncharacterized protein n=1 Tax=Trypanosoma rangeli TaxID=5698 RepID=A0A3S5IQM1_TRYRA|nr:uncharacterized protein TraAM80_07236 [Trypanosoma rangeli]RNF01086.1 hypothetical protein TraAM80_07236 [Trypanosoma rangeli]|eukprot:RNF01086.1 hypothetical protein TraAM80_07236 [Trypanosoma rangeli]
MLGTALMLSRVTGARKRALHVLSSCEARGVSKLAELNKRLREDEAERVFMAKIREDRKRREKVIAKALRRALAKRAKGESRLLRQYEANKVMAAKELQRMKEKLEAPPEALKSLSIPRVKKAMILPEEKKRRGEAECEAEREAKREAEREAERNFYEMIEKLRRRRESEMLAENGFRERLDVHAPTVKEEAYNLYGSEFSGAPTVNEESTDSLTAQDGLGTGQLAAAAAEVVEQPVAKSMEETREEPGLRVAPEEPSLVVSDKAAQKVQGGRVAKTRTRTLQPKQEHVKPHEKGIGKTPVKEHVPAAHQMMEHEPMTQQMVADNFAGYYPRTVDQVQPSAFQRPLHAVSLTGFNEPPLISSVGNTLDFGHRRVQPLPLLEAPVIPLRPRAFDAFPPVVRMAPGMPISFPHNIPFVRSAKERLATGSGLHRL